MAADLAAYEGNGLMHIEALTYIQNAAYRFYAPTAKIDVVEFGGLDVNGGLRHLFPRAKSWTSVDIEPGPGVDLVADAADWIPPRRYDLVICAEVFEHTNRWQKICITARVACNQTGVFIATAATNPRALHGAYDPDGTHGSRPDEYYQNVRAGELLERLRETGFMYIDVTVDGNRGDVYACARP